MEVEGEPDGDKAEENGEAAEPATDAQPAAQTAPAPVTTGATTRQRSGKATPARKE